MPGILIVDDNANIRTVAFVYADGVNQSLASTFQIDRVIAKPDSIRTLGEHLKELLTQVNGPTRQPGITGRRTEKRDQPA
jgi:hypothetical protein